MFNSFVHFALIAALLGCPPSCWLRSTLDGTSECGAAGLASAQPSRAAGGCCCHKSSATRIATDDATAGDRSTPRPQSPRPGNDDDFPGGPCQCVCGGAVVDDHVAFDAADAMHALDVIALVPQAFYLAPAESTVIDGSGSSDDDDVLSGREICRLHSLMRC